MFIWNKTEARKWSALFFPPYETLREKFARERKQEKEWQDYLWRTL